MARAPIVLVDGLNMLKRLMKDYPDSPMAVVFDAPGKTFRDELYSDRCTPVSKHSACRCCASKGSRRMT